MIFEIGFWCCTLESAWQRLSAINYRIEYKSILTKLLLVFVELKSMQKWRRILKLEKEVLISTDATGFTSICRDILVSKGLFSLIIYIKWWKIKVKHPSLGIYKTNYHSKR